MQRWMKTAADYLFPPRCPVCDALLAPGSEICGGCEKEAVTVREPVCARCGKPLENERQEYCGDCAGRKHSYEQGKAVFVYRTGIKKSMYRFKYSNRREYAQFYARKAALLYGDWIARKHIEVIVPVPMYPKKKRRRGYNQAEVFAKALGRELGIPVEPGLLKRVRNTVPQKELSDAQRQKNLKNAFQLVPDVVEYSHILLVDDIYTTGSTMDEAAKALLSGGAERVCYVCISIGAGF